MIVRQQLNLKLSVNDNMIRLSSRRPVFLDVCHRSARPLKNRMTLRHAWSEPKHVWLSGGRPWQARQK